MDGWMATFPGIDEYIKLTCLNFDWFQINLREYVKKLERCRSEVVHWSRLEWEP